MEEVVAGYLMTSIAVLFLLTYKLMEERAKVNYLLRKEKEDD